MIKEIGTVVQQDNQKIWVETAIKSTCKTCAAKSNCGTSAIAEAFTGKSVINEVKNTLDAKVGDQVEIGIPEESLLQGAFWIYLVPIFMALIFCLTTQYWLSMFVAVSEGVTILATFLGGFIGFKWAKYSVGNTTEDKYLPQLLAIKPEIIAIKAVQD